MKFDAVAGKCHTQITGRVQKIAEYQHHADQHCHIAKGSVEVRYNIQSTGVVDQDL